MTKKYLSNSPTPLTPYIQEIKAAINDSTIKTDVSIDEKTATLLKITIFTLSAAIVAAAIIRTRTGKAPR